MNQQTIEDRITTIARLRKEAAAKLLNAEALDAETDALIEDGKLDPADIDQAAKQEAAEWRQKGAAFAEHAEELERYLIERGGPDAGSNPEK